MRARIEDVSTVTPGISRLGFAVESTGPCSTTVVEGLARTSSVEMTVLFEPGWPRTVR